MTSSIPSGFSSDDLKKMLENAMPEPEAKESHTCGDDCEFGDNDQDKVLNIARKIEDMMDELSEAHEVPPQLVAKLSMIFTINRMIEWHSHVGMQMAENDQARSAIGWARDAGKFQAIANILDTISVDEDDFTCPEK